MSNAVRLLHSFNKPAQVCMLTKEHNLEKREEGDHEMMVHLD